MSKPTTTLKTWRKKMWVVTRMGTVQCSRITGEPYLYARKRDAEQNDHWSTVRPVIVTIEPVKGRKSK